MTAKSATITVKLLNKDGLEGSLRIAAMAARTCTDTVHLLKMKELAMDEFGDIHTVGENDPVLKSCLNAGHMTIFEHINYIFEWRGISRSLLQQISRHRHTSPCVESTRWTLAKNGKIEQLKRDGCLKIMSVLDSSGWLDISDEAKKTFNEAVYSLTDLYDRIADLIEAGAPADLVKYFLPEATPTNEVICINARELRHIIELRTASRALGEFRELCDLILGEISEALNGEHDFIFEGVRG